VEKRKKSGFFAKQSGWAATRVAKPPSTIGRVLGGPRRWRFVPRPKEPARKGTSETSGGILSDKRGEIRIMFDILDGAEKGESRTGIMYRTRISYAMLVR
jgi:hypothetical protein